MFGQRQHRSALLPRPLCIPVSLRLCRCRWAAGATAAAAAARAGPPLVLAPPLLEPVDDLERAKRANDSSELSQQALLLWC